MRADYNQPPGSAQNPHELPQHFLRGFNVLHDLVDCHRVEARVGKRQTQRVGDDVRNVGHQRAGPEVHPDSIVTETPKTESAPAFAASGVENSRLGRGEFVDERNVSLIARQGGIGIGEFRTHRLAMPIYSAEASIRHLVIKALDRLKWQAG